MSDVIEEYTKFGYRVEIIRDSCPLNPRGDFDVLGRLLITKPPRGCAWSDKSAQEDHLQRAVVTIPVYVLDHSGICINTEPFNDPWDSWMAGYYYALEEDVQYWYKGANVSAAEIEKELQQELRVFNDYLQGDVFGYVVYNKGGDAVDSTFGYYGYDSIEDMKSDIESFLEYQHREDNPLFDAMDIVVEEGLNE